MFGKLPLSNVPGDLLKQETGQIKNISVCDIKLNHGFSVYMGFIMVVTFSTDFFTGSQGTTWLL